MLQNSHVLSGALSNGVGVTYSGIRRPWEWMELYNCAPYIPSWRRHCPR